MVLEYEWIEDWATIPYSAVGAERGRTHGVEISSDGRVFVFHQADPALLILDSSGNLLGRWGNFPGAHAMTLVEEDGIEFLWLVDEVTGAVVKTTLGGEVVQELPRPTHPIYDRGGRCVPTWVSVNEERFGGNGDVWLADGYGSSLVHRYSRHGELLGTLTGEEGAGRFQGAHGIRFDPRKDEPELYVTDRKNGRVQVFDGEGRFKRAFGEAFLVRPCAFAFSESEMAIPDLHGRVVLTDEEDRLVAVLGETPGIEKMEGWPNNRANFGSGQFNAPHDAAFDREGNLYVVEWILGGRITKLRQAG